MRTTLFVLPILPTPCMSVFHVIPSIYSEDFPEQCYLVFLYGVCCDAGNRLLNVKSGVQRAKDFGRFIEKVSGESG